MAEKNRDYLSSFGRNRGRSLRPHQQSLLELLLPKISVSLACPLDKNAKKLALEIGFGGGEHLAAQALHNPDTLYIGCEPYVNGVAKLLCEIQDKNIQNIRIHMGDAREVIQALPPASVDEVFILFPDPWPKTRHNKRRLVNAQTLAMLARVHKKAGRLLLATDHVDYGAWMLELLAHHPDYTWTAERAADWQIPPADWTQTKYQRKTTEQGRLPQFFECVRN